MRKTRYYMAYGSNLNKEQMAMRCPHAKIMGVAVLQNTRLVYKGSKTGAYLTIEPYEGKTVPVAVWETTFEDELNLDRYEGYPRFYRKEDRRALVHFQKNGRGYFTELDCYIYIMNGCEYGIPSTYYINTCRTGYDEFGFNQKVLQQAYTDTIDMIRTGDRICPMCEQRYHGIPAISRLDNKTEICPDCGIEEAIEDYISYEAK